MMTDMISLFIYIVEILTGKQRRTLFSLSSPSYSLVLISSVV